MIAYFAEPGREISIYPRFYVGYHGYNIITCKQRRLKMLEDSAECVPRNNYAGKHECYVSAWVAQRLIRPLNCTTFYLHWKTAGVVPVCDTGVIAQHYRDVQNLSLNTESVSVAIPLASATFY